MGRQFGEVIDGVEQDESDQCEGEVDDVGEDLAGKDVFEFGLDVVEHLTGWPGGEYYQGKG